MALIALIAGLWSVPSAATEEDAATLFAEGRRLRKEDNCAQAIVQFQRAFDVHPAGLGSLRNIAECQERLGQHASARRSWWTLRRLVLKDPQPKYAGWAQDAEGAHGRLADKVPRLVVRLEGAARSDVNVAVDGEAIPLKLLGVELERDVGEHRVDALDRGRRVAGATVILAEGDHKVVTLAIPNAAQDSSAEAAPPPAPETSALAPAGYVALGVGGLGVVGVAVAIALRQTALADLENGCPQYATGACPPSVRDAVDRGTTASTLANVFTGVAAVGLGTGVALLIANASGDAPEPSSVSALSVAPLPGGGFLRWHHPF